MTQEVTLEEPLPTRGQTTPDGAATAERPNFECDSAYRALGAFDLAQSDEDEAGRTRLDQEGRSPTKRIYGAWKTALEDLSSRQTDLLITPARSSFALFYAAWHGGVYPGTAQTTPGFSQFFKKDPEGQRRIISDQFITLASQADPDLLARPQDRDDPKVFILDDFRLNRIKLDDTCRKTWMALLASQHTTTGEPVIQGDAVFDTVYDAIADGVSDGLDGQDTATTNTDLLAQLKADDLHDGWINNRYIHAKPIPEQRDLDPRGRNPWHRHHPFLADVAARRTAVLHRYMNQVCLANSTPLVAWSPLTDPAAVPFEQFSALLYDQESWHWVEITAAANEGHGRRDFVLLPQGLLGESISKALGESVGLVDYVAIYASTSPEGFETRFSLSPMVRLKALDDTAVTNWVGKLLGRSVKEIMSDYDVRRGELAAGEAPSSGEDGPLDDNTYYSPATFCDQITKEGVQLLSFMLGRRVMEAMTAHLKNRVAELRIADPQQADSLIRPENREYARLLVGDKLFRLIDGAEPGMQCPLPDESLLAESAERSIWEPRTLPEMWPGLDPSVTNIQIGDDPLGRMLSDENTQWIIRDHHGLGDYSVEDEPGEETASQPDLNIYDELMGYCRLSRECGVSDSTTDTADPANGHVPWKDPSGQWHACSNLECRQWKGGILHRRSDKTRTLTQIKNKLAKRWQARHCDQAEVAAQSLPSNPQAHLTPPRLRLYLLVLGAIGFAVPTVRKSDDGMSLEEAFARGESGRPTYSNPLGGLWAPGSLTS
ncbi:MAG: hypothetical protein LBV30_08570 [Propionibacteriaceae bacterium]|jgi:hypothetical protein|nr:hypothetical protein [Propionibacteriaceae bacterium]